MRGGGIKKMYIFDKKGICLNLDWVEFTLSLKLSGTVEPCWMQTQPGSPRSSA